MVAELGILKGNGAQSHAGKSWAPDHAFNEASAAAAKRVLKGASRHIPESLNSPVTN